MQNGVGGAGLSDGLLVVGRDIGFSDELVNYALKIAKMMGYSIIAVNLYAYPGVWRLFSDSTISVADEEELKEHRDSAAQIFSKKAQEQEIDFLQLVRVGDLDSVVRQLYLERGNIDLVLVEPEHLYDPENGPRSIPAFSLAPSEDSIK